MTRDWSKVIARYGQSPMCRIRQFDRRHECEGRVEFAHITPRALDKADRGSGIAVIDPLDICPLCRSMHDRYDGRDKRSLDLLPFLTIPEQVRATERMRGIAKAYRHITNERRNNG